MGRSRPGVRAIYGAGAQTARWPNASGTFATEVPPRPGLDTRLCAVKQRAPRPSGETSVGAVESDENPLYGDGVYRDVDGLVVGVGGPELDHVVLDVKRLHCRLVLDQSHDDVP